MVRPVLVRVVVLPLVTERPAVLQAVLQAVQAVLHPQVEVPILEEDVPLPVVEVQVEDVVHVVHGVHVEDVLHVVHGVQVEDVLHVVHEEDGVPVHVAVVVVEIRGQSS